MTHPWEHPLSGAAAVIADAVRAAVPVLTTERLMLRAPRVTDFQAYAAIFMSDRAVHMGGPYDREGAWADFTQPRMSNGSSWISRRPASMRDRSRMSLMRSRR